MNRIFRIIWSQALQAWVVASELATRRGKGGTHLDRRVGARDRDAVERTQPTSAWPLRVGITLALMALYAPAQAADRYWDANGTAVGFGGTGTWNTSSPFWSLNSDGVSGPYSAWNNAALDDAFFGGTPGTVTLGAPITVHNLTFLAHGYTLTGSTLTLGGVTPTININSGAALIQSALAGSAGVTKTGGGHLHLQGNSTFTGGINLLGGRLIAYSDAALGAASNGVTMANGTEFFTNGAVSASRVLTINGTVGLLATGGLNARITGSGGVTVAMGGTVLNNDASDYTGQTRFGDGTFGFTSIADLGLPSALGAPGAANGTLFLGTDGGGILDYLGDGDSSNRNWQWAGNSALRKSGVGVLDVNGPQPSDFDTVEVVGGTLHVAGGGSVSAMHTTVESGATLDVQGTFTGTEGDDTFLAHGTVNGPLAFGAGNDDVAFIDADISDLTVLDGGDGDDDRLSFDGMLINDEDVPTLSGWEQGELLGGSVLQLGGPMVLGSASNPDASVLVIDPTSRLVVSTGAQVLASVANAGTIEAGPNRLAIGGDYIGNGGLLQIGVSPANGTSGGLDIAGDVTGTTSVAFTGDGTDTHQLSPSILVIASPNDDLATDGEFTTGGIVRLDGSVLPWTLGQHADNSWYLDAEADALLPEIGAYAILSSIGRAAITDTNRLLFQRMSAVRDDTPRCGAGPKDRRAYWHLTGDCRGLWMAATASELVMDANPGFAFSGDSVGLYIGADVLMQDRETRTLRSGAYLGFQRGNYWTTGGNSTAQQGSGESNVRTDTPTFGLYQSIHWRSGTYFDVSLTGQLPEATIMADGFREEIPGNSLTLGSRVGHRYPLRNGWSIEPQLQLEATGMHWADRVDASGKALVIDDDVFGTARMAVRATRPFEAAGGARIRPWFTLGVQDTFGEKEDALGILAPGSDVQAQPFPNHAWGLTATLDVGLEAELNAAVSLFGVLSIDESLRGTDTEQRQANVGIRVRW